MYNAVGCVGDYTVKMKPAARKELEALPDNVLARIVTKIESLAGTPRPAGCKKLRGYKDQWRIRAGDWRVIYIHRTDSALSREHPTRQWRIGGKCTTT